MDCLDSYRQRDDYPHFTSTSRPTSSLGNILVPAVRVSSLIKTRTPVSNILPVKVNQPDFSIYSQSLFDQSHSTWNGDIPAKTGSNHHLSQDSATDKNQLTNSLSQSPPYYHERQCKDRFDLSSRTSQVAKNDEENLHAKFTDETSLALNECISEEAAEHNVLQGKTAIPDDTSFTSGINDSQSLAIPTPTGITESSDLYLQIPKFLGPSESSLSIKPATPTEGLSSDQSAVNDRDQTTVAMAWRETGNCGSSTGPIPFIPIREKPRVYLDSSSSYYTSNASSFRSSIDLITSPVPPIPEAMVDNLAKGLLPHTHMGSNSPLRVIPVMKPLNSFLHEGSNNGAHANDLTITDHANTIVESHSRPTYLEPVLNCSDDENAAKYGSSATSQISFKDASEIRDCDSSVLDAESTRKPLLIESGKNFIHLGDKKWELSNEKFDRRWKTAMHRKSHSNSVIPNEMRNWLDEQHSINMMRQSPISVGKPKSMTFKSTFTKSISKLRNRLSANLKSSGTLSLTTSSTVKNAILDGRGEFSRLHTPTESITTDKTTILGDYINVITQDVTPNSEQVMADITFSPSLPTEFRLDGGLEDYDDFQVAKSSMDENTFTDSLSEITYSQGSYIASQQGVKITTVNQNRYSAIYDDCVLFPFPNDDESGDEKISTSNPDFIELGVIAEQRTH